MARLNKDMKAEFVNAVLADITDHGVEEKLINVARKAYLTTVPKAVLAIFEDEKTKDYVHVQHICFCASEDGGYNWSAKRASVPNLPYTQTTKSLDNRSIVEKFPEVKKAWEAWRDFHLSKEELSRKLYNVANICSSTQKLIEALPELEQYVSDNAPVNTAGVPQTNDIAVLLSTLGWKEKDK